MIERFQGKEGRPVLMDALRRQFLIDGSTQIAEKIASAVQLTEYYEGEALLTQGDRGGDLCLIVAGKVSVRIDGEEVAIVAAGSHVGEIGLLEPFRGRTASVIAIDTVVAAFITQRRFFEIASAHSDLWRRLALELAHRLVKTQTKG